MAITTYFYTEGAVGNREDLTDVLTNISPTETPFISSIGRTTASSTYHEWQTDTLAAAAANAQAEGFSAASIAASGNATTRCHNYCQLFGKTAQITGTEKAMNPAGRSNEMSYQLEKVTKALARDIELQCCRSSAQNAGDTTAGTARQLEGLGLMVPKATDAGWLSSNSELVNSAAGLTGGRENLTETDFNNLMQTIWTAGGRPDACHVGGYQKRVISSFSGNNTRFLAVAPTGGISLNTDVEVYNSDYGSVRIILNRYAHPTSGCIIETQYWKLAVLRGLQRTPQGSTGDRESILLVTELTLGAYSYTSSGKWIGGASASGATT